MSKIRETITTKNQSSRNGYFPQAFVCHICDGSYEGTKAWFSSASNTASSSHFIVSQEGKICQVVDLDKMAWCNGTSTDKSSSMYYGYATSELVQELKGNANWYTVSIEHEGYYNKTQGALTEQQLEATVWLIKYIAEQIKSKYNVTIPFDRKHILGHYEINPKTKPNCPGHQFPWQELMSRLNSDSNSSDNPDSSTESNVTYRVVVGSFNIRNNANDFKSKLKEDGYDSWIDTGDDSKFRVVVGSFKEYDEANKFKSTVERDGYNAFIYFAEV